MNERAHWLLPVGLLAACAISVHGAHPRPNIDLARSAHALSLQLDAAVPQDIEGTGAEVVGWRQTLSNGFHSGFAPFFDVSGRRNDLTLVIVEAWPQIMPTELNRFGGIATAEARVRYKARLVDASGNVVKRCTGTARGMTPFFSQATIGGDATDAIASGVAAMYEQIAKEALSDVDSLPRMSDSSL
jgi:hypothetical protein